MESAFDPQDTAQLDLSAQEQLLNLELQADRCILCFQPVYELETGRVMHNEVLVRWQNSQGELLSPQVFLEQLRTANLLGALDRLVVAKAIAILGEQRQVILAVNLSAVTLGDKHFLDYVKERLMATEIDPGRLGFELPETLLEHQQAEHIIWLQELRQLGCWITLDGCTGKQFSLQTWQSLPVDWVKLDRQLVAQFEERETQDLAIALVKINQLSKHMARENPRIHPWGCAVRGSSEPRRTP
jgi:EAL domain-containing protein (putative c-di-GMP-specific phosphodiesterase class I)